MNADERINQRARFEGVSRDQLLENIWRLEEMLVECRTQLAAHTPARPDPCPPDEHIGRIPAAGADGLPLNVVQCHACRAIRIEHTVLIA